MPKRVTPVTYRGEDAKISIGGKQGIRTHGVLGMADFSLTMTRDTIDQSLLGEKGNYHAAGALGIEGSFTACKLTPTAAVDILTHVISGTRTYVSGNCGPKSLKFFFASCLITNFDLTIGDAGTITEGSIDWSVINPQDVKSYMYGQSPDIPESWSSGAIIKG